MKGRSDWREEVASDIGCILKSTLALENFIHKLDAEDDLLQSDT